MRSQSVYVMSSNNVDIKVFVRRFIIFFKEIIVWFITSAKGGYVFGRDGLSVCLSVSRHIYKVINGFA